MSGRSAHVRKKITETKRSNSLNRYSQVDASPPTTELSALGSVGGTLRPDTALDRSPRGTEHGDESDGLSQSASLKRRSTDGSRSDNVGRPLDDFAYARARRPTIKPDDVSGISKSGVRSAYDKKSGDIRRGLSKAFSFGTKKGRGETVESPEHKTASASRADRPDSAEKAQAHQPPRPPIFELPGDSCGLPTSPPPRARLPALPSGPLVRRWIGTGRSIQRWNKLRKDPEMWDPSGDVLIYLSPKGQSPGPDPSLRLPSRIIEATDSRQLITMLREGAVEDSVSPPPSSHGTRASLPPGAVPHLRGPDGAGELVPLSSAISDGLVRYRIYFPPPSNANKADQLRHQLTTRNIFALLCHVSLVGLSLYQALSDLLDRLDQYMPENKGDNLLTIMSYLSTRGIDDVRNDAESAVGLLAWSEDPRVRWEEAWREAFVHAAGLFATDRGRFMIESCADFKRLSPITRALLERSSLETQLRVQAAEERLAAFSFGDMWPASIPTALPSSGGALSSSPAKDAADRLQRFFVDHYQSLYGRWPPPPPPHGAAQEGASSDAGESMWLTRRITQTLQKDFGSLYDFLVNRDIVWDVSETRPSRKWLMISESGNRGFEADTADLPMTDMLIEFDNRQRFPHIPHPYPLVPESMPPQPLKSATAGPAGASATASTSSSMKLLKRHRFSTDNSELVAPVNTHRQAASERRLQLAYTESTNVYALGSDFTQSELIDVFAKFEKTDHISEIDPNLARRARWVVVYGVLQTLASISVDAPGVRYRDDVPYHLSPQLKGARIPPWGKKGTHGGAPSMEAAHELSHCWVTPLRWAASNTSASEDEGEGVNDEYEERTPSYPTVRLPSASPEEERFGRGFARPPALVLGGRSASGSDTTHSPTSQSFRPSAYLGASANWANSEAGASSATLSSSLHGDPSQSTTRATTPTVASLPSSPALTRDPAAHRGSAGPLHAVPLSATGMASPPRSRFAREDGEDWSPMRRAEPASESVRRQPVNTARWSEISMATTFGGRGRWRRKSTDEGTGETEQDLPEPVPIVRARSRSPGDDITVEDYDDLDVMDDGDSEEMDAGSDDDVNERPLLRMSVTSSVAPVIRDFDALSLDDSVQG